MPTARIPSDGLILIDAPHFSAAVVLYGGRIEEAAPIVRYMNGWSMARLITYCLKKDWDWMCIPDPAQPPKE